MSFHIDLIKRRLIANGLKNGFAWSKKRKLYRDTFRLFSKVVLSVGNHKQEMTKKKNASKIVCRIFHCLVTLSMSRFFFIRTEKDCFNYDIRFYGVKFPANGPVMKKQTVLWEPSTETMYIRDGVLVGEVSRTLLLEGGGHYRCDFQSTYRWVFMRFGDSRQGIHDEICQFS